MRRTLSRTVSFGICALVLLCTVISACRTSTSTQIVMKDPGQVGLQYSDGVKTETVIPVGKGEVAQAPLFSGHILDDKELKLSISRDKSGLWLHCPTDCLLPKYLVFTGLHNITDESFDTYALGQGEHLTIPLPMKVLLAQPGNLKRDSGAPMTEQGSDTLDTQALADWDNVTVTRVKTKNAGIASLVGLGMMLIGAGTSLAGVMTDQLGTTISGSIVVIGGGITTLVAILWSGSKSTVIYPSGP